MTSNRLTAMLLIGLLVTGCTSGDGSKPKKTGTVSGKVTFSEKGVENGVVNLEGVGTGAAASAPIKDGEFTFPTPVEVGQYKVSISPPPEQPPVPGQTAPPADPKDIPAKYRSIKTSDIPPVEVKEGENKFDFSLKP
ncbi:MAG: hypothetical protein IT428_20560 [Planctomycetaceae bacterium]|nr:hypothetical protein [Planctomycetaceae bacterium]